MLENISREEIKNQWNKNNKLKLVTMIIGGCAVLALAWFLYLQAYWNPTNDESKDKWWIGVNLAAADSTDAALDALRPVKENFNGFIGGEIAQFVYARQMMEKGEFNKAIEDLDDVSLDDTYVKLLARGLKADCLSELKKYEEAANLYLELADEIDNDWMTPMFLKKAGLNAEEINDYKMATKCYTRITDAYPVFSKANNVEKYLARASNQKAGK